MSPCADGQDLLVMCYDEYADTLVDQYGNKCTKFYVDYLAEQEAGICECCGEWFDEGYSVGDGGEEYCMDCSIVLGHSGAEWYDEGDLLCQCVVGLVEGNEVEFVMMYEYAGDYVNHGPRTGVRYTVL